MFNIPNEIINKIVVMRCKTQARDLERKTGTWGK